MNAISEIPRVSNTFASRALIVSVNISQWSGHAFDRRITAEVNASHSAAEDASRVNKRLLPKSAMADIQKKANAIRTGFNERTLPWLDGGQRVLAAETYQAHADWFRKEKDGFEEAVSDFLKAYPDHVRDAEKRLGGMFSAADYPSEEEIAKKFGIEMRTMAAPDTQDMRIAISDAQADTIRADVERTMQEATTRAVSDVYRRVRDVCERMVDRLNAYQPAKGKGERAQNTFRDSLVENVRDLIKVMPALNITGDPELEKLARKLNSIAEHDADVLRLSSKVRSDTAAEAQAILDQMGAFVA